MKKLLNGRLIAAAYWISYFAIHWLTILGVVPHCATTSGTTIYFLVFAVLFTILAIAHEETSEKK